MSLRQQRSIARSAEVSGFGLFSGSDARLRFLPAEPDAGIVFRRVDLPGAPEIPASLDFVETTARRTSLVKDGARVELTEHVLAALAGLQIDNCVVEIDAPEVPGMDGSCREFVTALLAADLVEQDRPRARLEVDRQICVADDETEASVCIKPYHGRELALTYHLDYGRRSPIPPQMLTFQLTPETFVLEICDARTFVLESEVAALKAAGYGARVTPRDLLVFTADGGVLDNRLRMPDECVRHKILDCLGDLALLGCDLAGHVTAWRSGHRMNQLLASKIRELVPNRVSHDRAA